MPAITDTRSLPPIAVHWVKNNVLAAIISGVGSLLFYGLRDATGAVDADVGFGVIVTVYVAWIGLAVFVGAVNGVLVRCGSAADTSLAAGADLDRDAGRDRGRDRNHDRNVSHRTAEGSGRCARRVDAGNAAGRIDPGGNIRRRDRCPGGARAAPGRVRDRYLDHVLHHRYAVALSFFAGSAKLLEIGSNFAGEFASQVLYVVASVMAALVMLPALRRLKTPLSTAPQYFT